MTASEAYFALIRTTLFGSDEQVTCPDVRAVMRIAVRQSTVALHAQALLSLPEEQVHGMTLGMKQWLQAQVVHNISAQQTRGDWMLQILTDLKAHHIPAVLIKGYGLAVLYGNPDLREQGDVDLFVGKERYHEACEVLRAAHPDCYWQSEEEGGKHFIFIPNEDMKRIVELHHQTAEFRSRKETQAWLGIERDGTTNATRTVSYKGFDITVPSPSFNAVYVFVHLWHHFLSSGCGWRQLTDWALVLREVGGAIDEEQLRARLKALHLLRPWQTFGCLLHLRLHLPADLFPLYNPRRMRLARRIDRLVLRDGHAGRKQGYFHKMERPAKRILQIIRVLGQAYESWAFAFPLFPDTAVREAFWKIF